MVWLVGVRLVGGTGHEHIASVRWREDGDSTTYEASREEIVQLIAKQGVAVATGSGAKVFVVPERIPYLRTFDHGAWRNHLLLLPRF
jgi:hypothetical protein